MDYPEEFKVETRGDDDPGEVVEHTGKECLLHIPAEYVAVDLPSLSERKGNLPVLIKYFLHKYPAEIDKDIRSMASDVYAQIEEYDFPGNFHELEKIIERSVVLAEGNTILPLLITPVKL